MDFGYQAIETEKAQNNISEMEMKKWNMDNLSHNS